MSRTSGSGAILKRRAAHRTGGQRGFALLIVLWTTSLLALIGTQVTSAGRTETRVAANIRGAAIAEAAADAAVQDAAMRLMHQASAGNVGLRPGYVLRLPQAAVQVGVEDESRLLPINTAAPQVIAALLRGVGADKATAALLAQQIAEWRTPANTSGEPGGKAPQYRAAGRSYGPSNMPFRDRTDLAMVLNMSPPLLARLLPHVSVYTQSTPKPEAADPLVLAALRQGGDGLEALTFQEPPVYRISALANAAGGGQFLRRAVIRISLAGDGGVPTRAFDVLDWRDGAAD